MPPGVRWGTPARTERYLWPRGPHALVWVALALGGAALLALGVLTALGRAPTPGKLISQHALLEARCQECHAPGQGASDARCQRCHDAAGGGRLTHAAHVLFGSGDPGRAAAAPSMACARCHVEHRGREARLSDVEQAQCTSCHFRRFGAHPEFALLRAGSAEAPGLRFPHARHMESLQKEKGLSTAAACGECHERDASGADFVPISFDRHCASCHASSGSLGVVDPLPEDDALPPSAIQALGIEGGWLARAEEYELGRGRVGKTMLRHRDEWLLFNLRRLGRQLAPEGYTAERAALLGEFSRLERRLALSTPLAGLSLDALEARAAALDLEARGIAARLDAAAKGDDAAAARARVGEAASAAAAAGDPVAAVELQREGSAPAPTAEGAMGDEELARRRQELLALLEAIEAADPALAGRAEDLRRRLLALRAGEASEALLQRIARQRALERARVEDERRLRAEGLPAPPQALLAAEQAEVRRALAEAQERLQELSLVPAPEGPLDEEARQRKKDSAAALGAPCAKCHILDGVDVAPVTAARRVLVRAEFVHGPHLLQAECGRCHPAVAASKASTDLNFLGVASCRECHRGSGATQACQACHSYHPGGAP
jgi:hypothetical protein